MCTFGRLQTGKGGNKVIQGVVKGHLCHAEQWPGEPPAGFIVSNWGFSPVPGFPQGVFCLFGTSG